LTVSIKNSKTQDFKNILAKCEELVKKLGKAFEKDHPNKNESICEEIKNELREEISEGAHLQTKH
jgi:hypothetical protein